MALHEKSPKKEKAKALVFGTAILEERTPIVAVVFDDATSENAHGVIEGLETLGVHTVMVHHPKACEHGEKTTKCTKDEKEALGTADIAVVFSEPLMALARKSGCVPVAPYKDDKSTPTYNPVQEKGNGFYFKNQTKWEIFAAIVRALETFQFPYDWENVVKAARK